MYLKSATGRSSSGTTSVQSVRYGIHVYTDAGAGQLVNITLDGNVAFQQQLGDVAVQHQSNANILVGGEEPVSASKC